EIGEAPVHLGEEVADVEAHLGVRAIDHERLGLRRGQRGRGHERQQGQSDEPPTLHEGTPFGRRRGRTPRVTCESDRRPEGRASTDRGSHAAPCDVAERDDGLCYNTYLAEAWRHFAGP